MYEYNMHLHMSLLVLTCIICLISNYKLAKSSGSSISLRMLFFPPRKIIAENKPPLMKIVTLLAALFLIYPLFSSEGTPEMRYSFVKEMGTILGIVIIIYLFLLFRKGRLKK